MNYAQFFNALIEDDHPLHEKAQILADNASPARLAAAYAVLTGGVEALLEDGSHLLEDGTIIGCNKTCPPEIKPEFIEKEATDV
jgi:hypothetical protein